MKANCKHLFAPVAVNCVAIDEHKIITGSSDCTLKSWSILSGRCLYDFCGHTGEVVNV